MINIFYQNVNLNVLKNYYVVWYYLESKTTLKDAAWNLAIGQSVGNPHNRSEFETDELFKDHSCLILEDPDKLSELKKGNVFIAFPEKNINFREDGISSLLVQIMGGQCDIDVITKCVVKQVIFTPSMLLELKRPYFGIDGMRKFCNVAKDKVLFGGIVKPKVGLSPEKHLDLVKQFIDNGCNFIKEDEILSNQAFCPIEKRIPLVANYIRNTNAKVFYCASLQADAHKILNYSKKVSELGGNGIHVNFHCGMGIYKSIREMNLPLLMHFQKSGDKILNCSDHRYHIEPSVLFQLAALSGCDTLHVGMIGGYMDNDTQELKTIIKNLNEIGSVPALSCGMHPGLIDYITNILGHCDWMANVGGAITSHPMGTSAGVKAMAQAINKNYDKEYESAIEKWGKLI
jgi:ribulose-bisphosphate carboxylase large chain